MPCDPDRSGHIATQTRLSRRALVGSAIALTCSPQTTWAQQPERRTRKKALVLSPYYENVTGCRSLVEPTEYAKRFATSFESADRRENSVVAKCIGEDDRATRMSVFTLATNFAENLRPGDIAVVAYSGHGGTVGGAPVIVTTGNEHYDASALNTPCLVYLSDVIDIVAAKKPEALVIVFDACQELLDTRLQVRRLQTGEIIDTASRDTRSGEAFVRGANIALLYATQRGDLASSGANPERRTPPGLMQVLNDHIRSPVFLDELILRVERDLAGTAQIPYLSSSLSTRVYLGRNPEPYLLTLPT